MKKLIILMALLSAPLAFCSDDYDYEITNIKTDMRMMKNDFENELESMKSAAKWKTLESEKTEKWNKIFEEKSDYDL